VRAAGVEPALQAWEAHVLPIYYARFEVDLREIEGQWIGKLEVGGIRLFECPDTFFGMDNDPVLE
jgi:hypothetical protein